jgi:hypothetical protein
VNGKGRAGIRATEPYKLQMLLLLTPKSEGYLTILALIFLDAASKFKPDGLKFSPVILFTLKVCGTTKSVFSGPPRGALTARSKALYVHPHHEVTPFFIQPSL